VRDAALYEEAFAAGTWTRSSVATILTGLYSCVHGAVHETDALAQWPVLLPEMLRGAGYTTRCINANGNIAALFGFDRGYQEFLFVDRLPASAAVAAAARRLAGQDPAKPVFMYLHTVEPHGPLRPRPDSLRRFDRGLKGRYGGGAAVAGEINVLRPDLTATDVGRLVDLYDARVFEADQAFGQFLAALKKSGRYQHSLIFLLSDHGEAFDEHDTFGHGHDLSRETMRVVLAVKYPDGRYAGSRVPARVSLVDLVPTVLSQAGLPPDLPYPLPGRSLAPDRLDEGRRVYAETSMWEANNLDLVAVIDEDGYKRVIDASALPRETASKQSVGLWDTHADPEEQRDLTAQLPVRAAYDEQLIASWLLKQHASRQRSTSAPPPKAKLSAELERKLRDLGYLRGGGAPAEQR
jgi:arylsulfatase A-like enzyme